MDEAESMGLRCDRCTHWEAPDDWEPARAGFRRCAAIKERWTITEAAVSDLPWPGGPHIKFDENDQTTDAAWNAYHGAQMQALQREKAYAQDGSDYRANLYTGPDFFCAKFESLQNKPAT